MELDLMADNHPPAIRRSCFQNLTVISRYARGRRSTPAIPLIEGLILVTAANSVLQVVVQPGADALIGSTS
jgi:hypothetical protein